MMGMEKMLASMIGISPDQMQAMAQGMATAANDGVALLRKIEGQNARIIALLEGRENGNGNNHG